MNILIVEDAKDQQLLLSSVLKKKGHQIFLAENGKEAFHLLKQNSSIQLVISDWMMPVMNGIELCKQLRQFPFSYYIYFILLTGISDDSAVIEGMNNGADDFLRKPVNFRELDARLKAGIRVLDLENKLEQRNNDVKSALKTIQNDLKSAATTLYDLIPKQQKINQLQFEWHFQPSSILGGDMLGYHLIDNEHAAFYQFDVSGHGIPAALFSFSLNRILTDLSSESSLLFKDKKQHKHMKGEPFSTIRMPHELFHLLNDRFQNSITNTMYFTIIYAIVHLPSGILKIAHAGHPSSLLISTNGNVSPIKGKGVPIGMMPECNYDSETIHLKRGSSILCYTDGVTESTNSEGELFGCDRLSQTINKHHNKSNKTIIDKIIATARQWQNSTDFDDDVSCLMVSWI